MGMGNGGAGKVAVPVISTLTRRLLHQRLEPRGTESLREEKWRKSVVLGHSGKGRNFGDFNK